MSSDTSRRRAIPVEEGYARLPDEQAGYEMPEENHRGPMILALAIGVMIVFGVVVWNAYKQGVRQNDAATLPQIASEGAFKRRPENPGGNAAAYTDKRVFDQIDGAQRDDYTDQPGQTPETIKVAGEGRASDGLVSKPPAYSKPQFETPSKREVGQAGKPVDLVGKQQRSATLQRAAPPLPAPTTPQAAPIVRPTPTQRDLSSAPIERPAPRPAPVAMSAPKPAFSTTGGFVVQLSAVKSNDAVDRGYANAKSKAPDLFAGAHLLVKTVDLGPKGVWHRIRVGSFDSRENAAAFCQAYKARGGDCIVTAK